MGGLLARATGEFVGRRREQRRLPAALVSPATAGAVLHGIGGVGKTTLAAELSRQILDHEQARVPAVLSGEISVDGVFSTVSGALQRHLLLAGAQGPLLQAAEMAGRVDLAWQDRFAWLRDHVLDQVPLLVVLDNFEDNLTPGSGGGYEVPGATLAGLLASWAASPGRSRLMVTSRYEFTLPDGAEHHLSFRHVGPLSMAETLKLIWSLPALDRLEEPELERVWRMVGGHPRTLEYLDALLRDGAGRYHDVTARLTHAVHAKLGRDEGTRWLATARDLDTALAESLTLAADDILLDELLSTLRSTPQAERLLVGASVYREPVDTNALLFQIGDHDETAGHIPNWSGTLQRINQILATHGIDPDQLPNPADLPSDVLAEIAPHVDELNAVPRPPRSTPVDLGQLTDLLAKTSLLAVDPDEATVFVHRWTASELERRSHAQDHHDQMRHAHQQAAEYWQWRVKAWPQGQEAHVHDLLEARHHLLACDDIEQAGALTDYVCSQLETWGGWDHGTALIYDTLARLVPDSLRRPFLIYRLGSLAYRRGDYEEAERRYRQSLQIFERLGNQVWMANSYGQLGILAQDRGDYEEAERRYQLVLRIFERLGDQVGMSTSYHRLGILAQEREEYGEAERRYQLALQIFERLGDQLGMSISYHQLGMLAQERGEHGEAERRYQQSLQIEERLGNQAGMATSWSQLGNLAEKKQQYADATVWHIRALLVRMRLQVPGAVYNARTLAALRVRMGSDAFVAAASTVVDETQFAEIQAALDSLGTDDSVESEVE